MKREQTLSKILGVSQLDMAMLLGITRGRWSMYEIGKRDIPVNAKVILAEVLTMVEPVKNVDKSIPTPQPKYLQQHIEHLLSENKYLRLVAERNLAATQRKHAAQEKLVLLQQHLESFRDDKRLRQGALDGLTQKASKAGQDTVGVLLAKQQLRLELLNNEKDFLEWRLKGLSGQ